MDILVDLVGLAIGIAALVWSADIFVGGSASLAQRLGVPPLIVGMVVIGFGTSMPEMLVSALSAIEGSPSIALGTAYGSNTANIGLILGVTAALAPVAVARSVTRRELPVLVAATALCWPLLSDGALSRMDALILLAAFVIAMAMNMRGQKGDELDGGREVTPNEASRASLGLLLLKVIGGLVILIGSSRLLVVSAIGLAKAIGVPDLVVGLTVVAVGTSLPELAASIAAVRRREHDLVIGNIIGSNLFNTLAVVGIACAISPMDDEASARTIADVCRRDLPFVCAATLLMGLFCIPRRRGSKALIGRWMGVALLFLYAAYVVVLVRPLAIGSGR